MDGVEADCEAQGVGLADDAAHRVFGVAAGEVVPAEVVVVDVVGEHVPDGGQDGVFQGDDRFLLPESWDEAVVAGAEVGLVLGAGGGHRGGTQGGPEPSVAVSGLA